MFIGMLRLARKACLTHAIKGLLVNVNHSTDQNLARQLLFQERSGPTSEIVDYTVALTRKGQTLHSR